jgi:hypothetical protein
MTTTAEAGSALAVQIPEGEMRLPARTKTSLIDLEGMSLQEAFTWIEKLCQSNSINANYRGKPIDAILAADRGMRLGFSFLDSLDAFAIINGRATIWGDFMLGVVYKSGLLVGFKEVKIGQPGTDSEGWRCTVRRRGFEDPVTNEFTMGDAKVAKLYGKEGPWTNFGPSRMCKWRARSWSLRDQFADVLKGLVLPDEVPEIDTEIRTQIAQATSRGDAILGILDERRALPAGAPESNGAAAADAAKDVEKLLDALAAQDPDFSKMRAQIIRDFVNGEAAERKVAPSELSAIEKSTSAGRLTRDNVRDVLRAVRTKGMTTAHEDLGDEIPASASAAQASTGPDELADHARAAIEGVHLAPHENGLIDLAAMSDEQLDKYVFDHAAQLGIEPKVASRTIAVFGEDNRVTQKTAPRILEELKKKGAAA